MIENSELRAVVEEYRAKLTAPDRDRDIFLRKLYNLIEDDQQAVKELDDGTADGEHYLTSEEAKKLSFAGAFDDNDLPVIQVIEAISELPENPVCFSTAGENLDVAYSATVEINPDGSLTAVEQDKQEIPTKWAAISGWLATLHGKLATERQKELCAEALEYARRFRSFLDEHYPGVTETWERKYQNRDRDVNGLIDKGNLCDANAEISWIMGDSSYCTACQSVMTEDGRVICPNCLFKEEFGLCKSWESQFTKLDNLLDELYDLTLEEDSQ